MKRRPYSVYWRKPEPVLRAWKVWVRPDAFTVVYDASVDTATATASDACGIQLFFTPRGLDAIRRASGTKKPPAKSG